MECGEWGQRRENLENYLENIAFWSLKRKWSQKLKKEGKVGTLDIPIRNLKNACFFWVIK